MGFGEGQPGFWGMCKEKPRHRWAEYLIPIEPWLLFGCYFTARPSNRTTSSNEPVESSPLIISFLRKVPGRVGANVINDVQL